MKKLNSKMLLMNYWILVIELLNLVIELLNFGYWIIELLKLYMYTLNVRCMHAVVWKVHGYGPKNLVFY